MKKSLLTFLLIIMIVTIIDAQIPTNGLVAYYPFNSNANDSSGNGKNALFSHATPTTDRFGRINSAFSFQNNFDSVTVPISLSILGLQHSISLWVLLDTISSPYPSFMRGNFIWQYQTNQKRFTYYSDPTYVCNSNISVIPKQWYHLLIINNNDTCKSYLNGVLQSTQYPMNLSHTGNSIRIGGNSGIEMFIGKVDDIRFYNRALSSNEVLALYNETSTTTPTIPTNGLVAWYPFNGNAKDSSGNGKNALFSHATPTTDRFGRINSAFSFQNIFDSVTVPISSSTLGLQHSISLWVLLDTFSSPYPSFMRGNFIWQYQTNQKRFTYYSDPTYVCNTNMSVIPKQWYHLLIINNNDTCKSYLNGVLQSSQYPMNLSHTGNTIRIGGNSGIENFIGKVDDIRFYNRALDSSEVQSLYHEGGFNSTMQVSFTRIVVLNNASLVRINWQTESELNNTDFIIQQSTDGNSFTDIGIITAKGSGANSYEFIDNNPTSGINYYRLKSIDKDGSSSYSKVVSVSFGENQTFSIAPNPAKDFATISFSKTVDKVRIAVYDITGNQVITQSLNGSTNSYKLNTQCLKNGLYIIKVSTVTGNYNEKLLINK